LITSFNQYPKDFDLEVFGTHPPLVKLALKEYLGLEVELVGRHFPVYKVKGWDIDIAFPRKETKTGPKHTDFIVDCDPNMSFEEASLRRDFRFNAIGYDWVTDVILDPHHGLDDIRDRVMDPVSEKFKEDALRVLRAFKFIARYGFKPSVKTIEYCKNMIEELKAYPRERVAEEWHDFIFNGKAEHVSEAFQFLKVAGASELYPEIFDLDEVLQDPQHHPEGKVGVHRDLCLYHFMHSVRNMLENDEERLIVGYAVLTHDFGKATETRIEDGKLIAHGHEDSPLARKFMERLMDPADIRIDQIEKLVKSHMRPVILYKAKAGSSAVRRLVRSVDGRIDRLFKVVECDQNGRYPRLADYSAIYWLNDEVNKLGIKEKETIKPIIKGRHIIEHLKLNPSPRFGEILNQIFEAQLDGKFLDEAGGIEYLKQNYKT
jgi:tRNA nucleotidyltransferase (CCA-adding enzyme)